MTFKEMLIGVAGLAFGLFVITGVVAWLWALTRWLG